MPVTHMPDFMRKLPSTSGQKARLRIVYRTAAAKGTFCSERPWVTSLQKRIGIKPLTRMMPAAPQLTQWTPCNPLNFSAWSPSSARHRRFSHGVRKLTATVPSKRYLNKCVRSSLSLLIS